MSTPILSIVIPVYNVAPYIEKCVLSCIHQDIPRDQYEIIMVNDGATDNSLSICETLKAEFDFLKIISQKNKGLSGARNTGLKHAVGKYVWFVDSDDWIKEKTLKSLVDALQTDTDIIWLGHDVWENGVATKTFTPKQTAGAISGAALFTNHLDNLFYIWKFVYRRSFLNTNHLTFLEGILYEDLEFTPRALLKAKKCTTISKTFYHYLIRPGSIATNVKPKNIEHRFLILDKLNALIDSGVSDLFKKGLVKVILHTADSTIRLASRSHVKLPTNAITLVKSFKTNKNYSSSIQSTSYKLMVNYPKPYYSLFKMYHSLRSIIKK
ncbi:hypothetical protein GCM10022291_05630 [Postechiella marina]|uniref:Glycosyltransferase 2-like domain-containing protein n=1 Tax=Postechiella marina TaxID=943941 RepID=A0ABP8C1G9_9FLAO